MAKITVTGINEYEALLRRIGGNVEKAMESALYEGAKIAADNLRASVQGLSVVSEAENLKAYRKKGKMHLSYKQKQGLLDGLGIAKFENINSAINTAVGFDGYNEIKTKKYPNGQPNPLIARVVESGSSYMDKTPFVRKTITESKKQIEEAMAKVFENEIEKIKKE